MTDDGAVLQGNQSSTSTCAEVAGSVLLLPDNLITVQGGHHEYYRGILSDTLACRYCVSRGGLSAHAYAAIARSRRRQELTVAKAVRLQESGEILPVQKIVEQVPGEITEVDLKKVEGQYAYQVQAIGDDGVKRQLTFDAVTGEFLYGEVEDDSEDQDDDNDEG